MYTSYTVQVFNDAGKRLGSKKALAQSIWQAEDKVWHLLAHIQPNRSGFKAIKPKLSLV